MRNSDRKRIKTQIDFGLELYERIQTFSQVSNEEPKETIAQFYDKYFPYMNTLKFYISRLPYSIRLFIIDYISVISSRFMISCHGDRIRVFSYEKKDYVEVPSYIKLMYGFFNQDFTRKPYLVFGYLVFRLNEVKRLYYIPQNQLRQVYLLDGEIRDYSNLPDRLQSLCLCKIMVEKSIFLPLLRRLKRLRKFAVKQIEGLNDLEIIKELCKVQVIRIMECELDSRCCQILCRSKNIVILNLCENARITSCGLEPFQHNTKATLLSLDDSGVDDRCIKYVERNKNVHQVEMNGTNITSRGLLRLISHPTIRWIEAGNIIFSELESNEYKKMMIPQKNLKNFMSLEKLLLDLAKIPKSLLQAVQKYCTGLSFVSLCNCMLTDADVRIVLQLPALTGLAASFNPRLTMTSVTAISKHPKLEKLEYSMEELGDEEVTQLFKSESIRSLWIEGGEMTNDCLLQLQKNYALDHLILCGENKVDSFGIEFIKRACTNIKELKHNIIDFQGERDVVTWFRD